MFKNLRGGVNYILVLAFSTLCLFGCSDDGNTPECRLDSDCASRTDGKTTCDVKNEVCVAPTANTPECTTDAQCAGRTDGKTTCDVKNEVCVAPTANTPECTTDAQCASRTDGKTTCDVENEICVVPTAIPCGEHEVASANGCICNNQENYYGNTADGCMLCAGDGTKIVDNQCVCDAAGNWRGEAASGCVCGSDDGNAYVTVTRDGEAACEVKAVCTALGQTYVDNTNACACDGSKHWTAGDDGCVCDDAHRVNLDGACVCDEEKGYYENADGQCVYVECDDSGVIFHGKCVHKGDYVTFGHYPQTSETPEPIEWLVYDISKYSEGAFLYMASKYVLDARPYHETYRGITWKDCTLRSWLNAYSADSNVEKIDYSTDGFLKIAFTEEEQKKLDYGFQKNSFYIVGGPDTADKVYILSSNELERYFSAFSVANNENRLTLATPHVKYNVDTDSEECVDNHCPALWWLRVPGTDSTTGYGNPSNYAGFVNYAGAVRDDGYPVTYDLGVRPFIYVDTAKK